MLLRKPKIYLFIALSLITSVRAELPVPCGACNGGVWVSSGSASLRNSSNALTIDQHTERAILNWESFNVSAGSRVDFRQPSTSSVALNRIFQSDPSRILGSLSANGQVLLINPNGILFGAGAQINTHSLIASTLGMPDDVFENLGLTGAINQGRAAFEGLSSASIDIEPGASIKSAKDGRIVIIASEINNAGNIESPDGQTILAASSDKVYLEASTDPELRGLLVEVETGGNVNNVGNIVAERGNVTLLGAAVNQSGRVRATTSVSRNGTVRLLGRDNATTVVNNQNSSLRNAIATRAGSVTLGEGSRTEVAIDSSDLTLASDAQSQPFSKVEINAKDVRLKSGAAILATGGEVDILAAENIQNPLAENFVANDASLRIDAGASINVAGASERDIPHERNFVEIDLRGNELRDNPVNRNGPIRGQTVVIDARRGTEFADVTSFIEATERSTAERLSNGGSISLRSEGSLVVESGSVLDISGGEISFSEGFNTASYLSREGSLIPIGDADPNVRYDGVFNFVERDYAKWSVTEIFNPFRDQNLWLVEPAYEQGADAGRLDIVARDIKLLGEVIATTTHGLNQRFASGSDTPAYQQLPRGGQLTLGDENTTQADYKLGNIILGETNQAAGTSTVEIENLLGAGVSELRVFSNGRIEVPEKVELNLSNGGALSLTAGEIDIAGQVFAPGGEIQLNAGQTVSKATKSVVNLSSTARLDASGNWSNDFADLAAGNPLTAINPDAGNISISSVGDVLLASGSLLDVTGGGYVDENAQLIAGSGGNVSIDSGVFAPTVESVLQVDGEIRGFSLDVSGTLSLTAQAFLFGEGTLPGFTTISPSLFAETGFEDFVFTSNTAGIIVPTGVELNLARQQLLFNGSSSNPIDVRFSELRSAPEPVNALLGNDPTRVASGASIFDNATLGQIPAVDRRPVNLSLNLVREASDDGQIRVENGARIIGEVGAAVTIESDRDIFFAGEIKVPAGEVSFTTKRRESVEEGYLAGQVLWLDGQSLIDVSGIFLENPGIDGLRSGKLFDAGTINLNANRSYLNVEAGSQFILDGVKAEIDLLNDAGFVLEVQSQQIAGAAGELNLRSGDGIFFAGDVSMRRAPTENSLGGSVTIDINAGLRETREIPIASGADNFLNGPRQIIIGAPPPGDLVFGGAVPASLNGKALLNDSLFTSTDLDTLVLSAPAQVATSTNGLVNSNSTGAISFARDVTLSFDRSLRLYTPELHVFEADVSLSAPVIEVGALGQSVPYDPILAAGNGSLSISADLMAVRGQLAIKGARPKSAVTFESAGDLVLAGTQNATNNASINGSLKSSSDLKLSAARIYPSTLSQFTIEVDRAGGMITTQGGKGSVSPLSVAGNLSLVADNVVQGGGIYAPFGVIDISAENTVLTAGSVTSVSGAGRQFLFGQTQFEFDWLLPFDGINILLEAAPEKRVSISGDRVEIAPGAIVDLSGGGDLRAFEFVPGPGGSLDILDPSNVDGAFAIVPNTLAQPLDALTGFGAGFFGDTFISAENSIIGAGEFAVLPARYALLPGAYLVSESSITEAATPGVTLVGSDEIPVIAGKIGSFGSAAETSLFKNYRLLSGEQVRARTEFVETQASTFFAGAANQTVDNGALSLTANTALRLGGSIVASGAGRASNVDLVAERLAVVNNFGEGALGSVEILAQDLNRLGAGSLLLGGTRTQLDASSAELNVGSKQIDILGGISLSGGEIVLSATDVINMEAGAMLATDSTNRSPSHLSLVGDAAVVAVSSGELGLTRSAMPGVSGEINVGQSAALSATGTVILDASTDANFLGTIGASGAQVSLGGKAVALGDAPSGLGGLVLSDQVLTELSDARSLNLRSSGTVDVYGSGLINLEAMTIDARGFQSFLTSADTFEINVNNASLVNSQSAVGGTGIGSGTFIFDATELDIGGGSLTFDGFQEINLNADVLTWSGESSLISPVATIMNVGVFTPRAGTGLSLAVAGHLAINKRPVSETVAISAPGGQFDISAETVKAGAEFRLPSGTLSFSSIVGDIDLSGAVVDLSGSSKLFDGSSLGTPGGRFIVDAAENLLLDNAVINVAGVNAAGGSVKLSAGTELSAVNATLSAVSAGQFSLFADNFDVPDVLATLQAGGFDERIDLRVRNASIEIGANDSLVANYISLVSDTQDVSIAGALLANDDFNGGVIRLFAGDELQISDNALISARGGDGNGGVVELGTSNGSVSVADALFDLSGSQNNGTLRIRAPALGGGAAINNFTASFEGVDLLEVEVFDVFNGSVEAAINGLNALSPNLAATRLALGLDSLPFARIVPGAELQLASTYTTSSAIDLSTRRYNGEPGVLTIRSSANINLNHNLSDGVVNYEPFPGGLPPREGVGNDDSWSYRLVAGADLNSADPLAFSAGSGDFTLGNNVQLRTGTGAIDVVAGNDLSLIGTNSNIYTVGKNRGTGSFGPLLTEVYLEADFVADGGNINIHAGGDITATSRDQLVNDWLARYEGTEPFQGLGSFGSGWGVSLSRFQQGIGALGGGDIQVRAAGDITELGVVVPTTGQPTGGPGSLPSVAGGGSISIESGSDYIGGLVYVGDGRLNLRSAGSIRADNANGNGLFIAMGDGEAQISSLHDLMTEAVFDPFLLPQSAGQGASIFGSPIVPDKKDTFSYFSSFTNSTSVALESVAGSILFAQDTDALHGVSANVNIVSTADTTAARVTVPSLSLVAHNGDVKFSNSFTLYPAPSGQLAVFAERNIAQQSGILNSVIVNLSDADPALLPSVTAPAKTNNFLAERLAGFDNALGTSHALVPLHINDPDPVRIVSRSGRLGATGSTLFSFTLAKAADIYAGGGIQNLNLQVQHSASSDLSVIESGADIAYPFSRNSQGFLSGATGQLAVAGPGTMAVVASGDIDLGTSRGIVSLGDTKNPNLPDTGADLIVVPGFGGTDNEAFAEYLFSIDNAYTTRFKEFIETQDNSTSADLLARFSSLDEDIQRTLLIDLFFEELIASGIEATSTGSDDYSRGFQAIDRFFADTVNSGDLSLLLSRISTVDGGDVSILVPGGFINAGVATATAIQKTPDQLGIVAQRDGNVNIFVEDDLLVNQSRVFTLDGGRIAIWSSAGDIDAGRGAKSAVSIPGLVTTIDTAGNVITEFPPAVEGSGIRAAVASPGRAPGDVFLFAPRGAVIAGDAGIGSAGNLTIGATEVVGADNIDVGGVSIGVPASDVASVAAGLTGVSDSSTSAAKTAQDSAGDSVASGDDAIGEALSQSSLSFISVEVLGFGG